MRHVGLKETSYFSKLGKNENALKMISEKKKKRERIYSGHVCLFRDNKQNNNNQSS